MISPIISAVLFLQRIYPSSIDIIHCQREILLHLFSFFHNFLATYASLTIIARSTSEILIIVKDSYDS